MLVLIDGSQHDWLEGRGPRLCLHLAIDDATGRILAACFRPTEDFEGYRQMLLQLVTEYGIPLAIYSDGSIYVAYKGQVFSVELVPEAKALRKNKATKPASQLEEKPTSKLPYKPAPDHPWRKRAVRPDTRLSAAKETLTTAVKSDGSSP
jgi:hypothetical protein